MPLFNVKEVDIRCYEDELRDFLPDRIVDIHTHIWKKEHKRSSGNDSRTVSWPSLVASENPAEDLKETYELMFPGKSVTPLVFSTVPKYGEDFETLNRYVRSASDEMGWPALLFSSPFWSAEELDSKVRGNGFLGIKSYLTACDPSMLKEEITIFDYFPHHQLEVLNEHGLIIMLHIPRSGRLKDPVNLRQLLEIDSRYPDLKCIVAHVGRAYCNEDSGDAFEVLKDTENLRFDISANTNSYIFEQALETFGSGRVLFGSDMPILRMRMKRITENGRYINVVPKGLYGDVSGDPNMRECEGDEAESLTFFMYEEIRAFKRAAENLGLSRDDVNRVFYGNSCKLLEGCGYFCSQPRKFEV